jgi:pyruvate dehydrogenase complex dehydrogenase (E1) component
MSNTITIKEAKEAKAAITKYGTKASDIIAICTKIGVEYDSATSFVMSRLTKQIDDFVAAAEKKQAVQIGYKVVQQLWNGNKVSITDFSKRVVYPVGEFVTRDSAVMGPLSLFTSRKTAEFFAKKFGKDKNAQIYAAEYVPTDKGNDMLWFKRDNGTKKTWPLSGAPKNTVLADSIKLVARV